MATQFGTNRARFRPAEVFGARWAELLFAAALVVGVSARFAYGRGMPLWLDETFTATIATQPTVPTLVRWCLNELTGPLFYGSMWLWAKLAGASTAALRLPSVVLSIAAPLLIYARGHPDRQLRLAWASVALVWIPILPFANDARPYALLFFLGCVQAIAFIRLIRLPGTRAALGWTSVTAALILTHYGALAIGATQGVLYLLVHRKAAAATWPALVAFVPVAAWMSFHLAFTLDLTVGPASNFAGLTFRDLSMVPGTLFGTATLGTIIIGTIAATLLVPRYRVALSAIVARPEALLAASGVLACAGVIGLAMLHAGFAPRYLMASMPALLFGVAWWLCGMARVDMRPVLLVGSVMLASAAAILCSSLADRRIDARHHFGFESASQWLMQRPPRKLVFLWTDAIADTALDRNMTDLASFAFRRDGHPLAVQFVRRREGSDTSDLALKAAGSDPATAILWIANDHDRPHPVEPRIAEHDRRWECREFGGGHVTVNACRHRSVEISTNGRAVTLMP